MITVEVHSISNAFHHLWTAKLLEPKYTMHNVFIQVHLWLRTPPLLHIKPPISIFCPILNVDYKKWNVCIRMLKIKNALESKKTYSRPLENTPVYREATSVRYWQCPLRIDQYIEWSSSLIIFCSTSHPWPYVPSHSVVLTEHSCL